MDVRDPGPPYFLGIDLGGTNVKSGVVDDSGRPLCRVSVETHAERGPVEGLATLVGAGQRAVAESGLTWDEIAAVGLGSPGTMDLASGMLLDPPNLPGWNDLPIRDLMATRLGKPTVLQNDGSAAAYGEFWAGGWRDARSLVLFTLGTGVGGGIVHEGRLIEGRHSHGAELGHVVIQADGGRLCPCGATGHLEAYASALSVVKRTLERLERESSSSLHDALRTGPLTSRMIGEAAEAGDPLARAVMSETARYLAAGAASLMHTIDPDVILYAGGMIAAGERFLAEIRCLVAGFAFPIPVAQTRIAFATLGADAGFIGAAGCARQAYSSGEPWD